jgi:hypothetical protein
MKVPWALPVGLHVNWAKEFADFPPGKPLRDRSKRDSKAFRAKMEDRGQRKWVTPITDPNPSIRPSSCWRVGMARQASGRLAPCPDDRRYFSVSAPAFAATPSCCDVPPETPMAPTIFPSISSGSPPSIGAAPRRRKMRRPSPPAATPS